MNSTVQVLGMDLGKRLKGLLLKRSSLTVGLHGPAGIGKTHTAQALLRQTPCPNFSLHSTAPLKQWLVVLPKPKSLELWAERLLERLAAGEPLSSTDAANALGTLLARLAPVVLYLEDIHEASAEHLELIIRLAEIVGRSKGVGLLLTSRTGLPQPIESISLEPLSSKASQTLLETQAGAELPHEALEWIFSKAAGNPLFSLEYFRHLARAGNLWNDGQRWRWREPERRLMPSTVEALVERTLTEASKLPHLEQILGAKAVLGLNTDQKLWSAVANLDSEKLEAGVQTLERRGILRAGGFTHPLYGEVLIHNLPAERRKALAQRAFDLLAEADPLAALDFVDDAGLGAETSLGWFNRAIEHAQALDGSFRAARLMAKAAEHAVGAEGGRLALTASKAMSRHNLSEAERLAALAVEATSGEAEAVFLHARTLATMQRGLEAERVLQSLPEAELNSPRGLSERIHVRFALGDTAGAIALWKEHPELIATAPPDTFRIVAVGTAWLGESAGALALVNQGLAHPQLSPMNRAQLSEAMGAIHFRQADYSGAAEHYAKSIEQMHSIGQGQRCSPTHYNRALALQNLGRYLEATYDIEQSVLLATQAGDMRMLPMTQWALGDQYFELGEYERAEEAFETARALIEHRAPSHLHVHLYASFCDLYCDWGSSHGGVLALKHSRTVLSYARQLTDDFVAFRGLFMAVISEARFGEAGKALEIWREMEELATRRGVLEREYMVPWARGFALEAANRPTEALAAFWQASQILADLGIELQGRILGLEVARLTNNSNLAQDHLAWFEVRGLTHRVNLARRYFPELAAAGGHTHSERPTPPRGARLDANRQWRKRSAGARPETARAASPASGVQAGRPP
jgi:tetratricopeptide (TPR) repeat protein